MSRKGKPKTAPTKTDQLVAKGGRGIAAYDAVLSDIVALLEQARRAAVRSVNTVMTATYWAVGQRIVEEEQGGRKRAGYGDELLERLAKDLGSRFGRGFGRENLRSMRAFYLSHPPNKISQTASGKSVDKVANAEISQTVSGELTLAELVARFPLSWSQYVRLLSVENENAREFYEAEALRGGWTVRQLNRQIGSQFYERTALSRNKAAMLKRGEQAEVVDAVTPEESLKDPFVLEFLDLKDEYSESDLEEALIRQLENFLLELGGDFTFVGRQRRLRIGDQWFRVDLVFFHRRLRCLVIIDLKLTEFSYADAGQMHMYLNYAREHWTHADENPPVGLILCAQKNDAVARYALEGLPNKVLAAKYRTTLPEEKTIAAEVAKTRK